MNGVPMKQRRASKPKVMRYEVCNTGPGSATGVKFSCITEALMLARHELKQGRAVGIYILEVK